MNCYFSFNGLFAPHWRSDARGTIVGLTQYTRREHICRATLEAVAFQVLELLKGTFFCKNPYLEKMQKTCENCRNGKGQWIEA